VRKLLRVCSESESQFSVQRAACVDWKLQLTLLQQINRMGQFLRALRTLPVSISWIFHQIDCKVSFYHSWRSFKFWKSWSSQEIILWTWQDHSPILPPLGILSSLIVLELSVKDLDGNIPEELAKLNHFQVSSAVQQSLRGCWQSHIIGAVKLGIQQLICQISEHRESIGSALQFGGYGEPSTSMLQSGKWTFSISYLERTSIQRMLQSHQVKKFN